MIYGKLEVTDVKRGLDSMMNVESIYETVVKMFLENYSNYKEELELLLHNDIYEAKRMIHSLKGISTNLGSEIFYQASIQFEEKIDQGYSVDDFNQYIDLFTKLYQDLDSIDF